MNTNTNPKEYLLSLEKTGNYVFHGSPFQIEEFEPKQAYQSVPQEDSSPLETPDGEPAVYATSFVSIAIFMAVINGSNFKDTYSGFSPDKVQGVTFWISQNTFDQIRNKDVVGFVYVFDKKDFQPQGSLEFVSYIKVKPIDVVQVSVKDLPENIEVKDF